MGIAFTSPAGHPRGSQPADQAAQEIRDNGGQAEVKRDMATDSFRVHVPDEETR
jgi:hypothetical protein